jgi:Ser/Thr protein kinase RdoA (MazF antagonist)
MNGLDEKEYFFQYIEEDIDRNIERIKKHIEDEKVLKSFIKKANISLEKLKNISNIKPVICWYDINPNNILVNEKSSITGFLDSGGARFAAKEWDLAFIKMDLCQNNTEYEFFKQIYSKQKAINEKLLEILTVVVELDDVAFQLEAKVKLPIAFESNFKEEIEYIQKEYLN